MYTKKLTTIFFVFLLASSAVHAQHAFDFSLTAGTLFSGKVQASYDRKFDPFLTVDFNIQQALMIKSTVDYNLWKYFSIGTALSYVPITISDDDFRELGIERTNIHMTEIDGLIKGRFRLAEKLLLKPYLALGYRHTFSKLNEAREHGFCLNGGLETLYYFNQKYFISCDLGFLSQPYGGVIDEVYIRAAPIFFAGIGIGISL